MQIERKVGAAAKVAQSAQGVTVKKPLIDETVRKAVEKQTRTVNLRYKTCCGCGCSEEKIRREVPLDSKLKDGDVVTNLLPSDRFV